MKQFVSQLDVQDRLNPRDSFFGGRTNAIKLHHKAQTDETIEYYDFTSLYPWTNKYCRYPVGHPTIITGDFKDISEYFGIAKVNFYILPPRGLYHPILPLKFPLCRTCADNENLTQCSCSDENRSIVGTWCTPELEMAVCKGYRIIKIYEIYHFEQTTKYDPASGTGGLFSDYVNTFLKIKQEASGFPDGCNTEEQKLDYIRQYKENEGIELEYDNIKVNPGLRCLAKLCLNSFWGKFGQRLNMKQSVFIHESEADEFFKNLSNPSKHVQDFHILTRDTIQLEWVHDPTFLPIDPKTNIFLATFTTTWARLRLYELLNIIQEDIMYMDTDSVIFIDRAHAHTEKLPIGNYLGELKNEIIEKDQYIEEFCSGGPKNYAYRTKSGKEVCKVRGFSLNWTNSQLINFDAIKGLIVEHKQVTTKKTSRKRKLVDGSEEKKHEITVTNPCKIARNSTNRILYNKVENKKYRTVYTKRVLLPSLDTVPYGF